MMEKDISERRKEPRIPIAASLPVIDQGSGVPLGELVNLSRHGMMLLSPRPIEINRVFQVTIPMSDSRFSNQDLSVGVESLWLEADDCRERFWVGFQIIDCSPRMVAVVEELLREFS